ncbi:MAG TPA: alpha-amylase family glycosyl hydrolase [Verrucomicrobiae bacterium]|nr:alpha-amylase family glycosyl hydrolase [Verrucomicrobiae bacterium]
MAHPLVFELNTRCWLKRLTASRGRRITLGTVPEEELDRWQSLGVSHLWLMGVWTIGPRSRATALASPELRRTFDKTLPGWKSEQVSGSPFAIGEYKVPRQLGGENGLQTFRRQLHHRGLKLLLDFVPNHLGIDHAWAVERPGLLVQSAFATDETFSLSNADGLIRWAAHGKDPNFPAWIDTMQLDYRLAETHQAMIELLKSVARRCDGVRCDMAMLLLSDVFAQTWRKFPCDGIATGREFWADAIQIVKHAQPGFIFLGEVYWDLEARLQSLGFDYTYDKRLYDYLVYRNHAELQRHLFGVTPDFIARSAHFLENHDEPRVAAILSPAEHRAAALLVLGLPGLRLLHDGQLTGASTKVPVQLDCSPVETPQPEIEALYHRLLTALPAAAIGTGRGELLRPRPAWPDNPTARNFVIVQWQSEPDAFDLVVINLAPHQGQCFVSLNVTNLARQNWQMNDLLGDETYHRFGDDLAGQGLYLDLPAHGARLFHFRPVV